MLTKLCASHVTSNVEDIRRTIWTAMNRKRAARGAEPLPALAPFVGRKQGAGDSDGDSDGEVQDQAGMAPGVEIKGGLVEKSGGSIKTWHTRRFMLDKKALFYFKMSKGKDDELRGRIPVAQISMAFQPQESKSDFRIVTPIRTYMCRAESPDEAASWVDAISALLQERLAMD